MIKKPAYLVFLLIITTIFIPSLAYAFIYEQKPLTITQIIKKKAYYVLVLQPDGIGNSTNLSPYGASSNWQCVNDSGDGDVTYVYTTSNGWKYDTYRMQNHTSEIEAILKVTVKIMARSTGGKRYAATAIRTHDMAYFGAQNTLTISYAIYSTEYNTNPFTGSAWVWGEIDALEAGVRLRGTNSRCTQVWIEVEYT